MDEVVVVGIAGGSASGKSTVVDELSRLLSDIGTATLRHDAYYHDLSHMPLEERRKVNVDHPDSLETDLLVEHLETLRRGDPVHMPDYDFASQTRGPRGIEVRPATVVLVEGLFVLSLAELRVRCDLRVFVDANEESRLARRIERDTFERGRVPAEVEAQHVERVEPMHRRFVAPGTEYADFIVEGGGHNREGIREVGERIRGLVGQRRE